MIFTFTMFVSLIISSPQKEPAIPYSSEANGLFVEIKEFAASLNTQLFQIPQTKRKDFIYTPPPGVDYKIKIHKPDSTIDYKINDASFPNKIYPFPDSLKRYFKNLVPRKK